MTRSAGVASGPSFARSGAALVLISSSSCQRGFGAYLLLIVIVVSALWFLALVSQLVR